MTRRFTGWHMTAIMIAFFGVVIAVNMVMAADAIRTFGGEVVENSYVASQRFNGWLSQARSQQRLGWSAVASANSDGKLVVDLATGNAAPPATLRVSVDHPLGVQPTRTFLLHTQGEGHYVSHERIGSGRWLLRIEAPAPTGGAARFEQEIRL